MAKQITFTYDDVDYTLEFTRNTVRKMERDGFISDEVGKFPMTMMPKFFAGAFLAHHRWTKPETIDEIFKHFPDKEALFEKLIEMYNEPLNTLVEEPEDDAKKVSWTASW